MKTHLIPLAFLLANFCCSQPTMENTTTFDITSEEAVENSRAAMLAELGEEEAKDLEHAFQIIFDDAGKNVDIELNIFMGDERADARNLERIQEYWGPLQGLAAQELIEHAKTLPNWVTR